MRHFDVLHHRFGLGLTQEETAECLYMSVRTVQRIQREATHSLTIALWKGWRAGEVSEGERTEREIEQADVLTSDWRLQAELELTSL